LAFDPFNLGITHEAINRNCHGREACSAPCALSPCATSRGKHPQSIGKHKSIRNKLSDHGKPPTSTRLSKKVAPPPRSVNFVLVVVLQLTPSGV
jgi:hypothetical protein